MAIKKEKTKKLGPFAVGALEFLAVWFVCLVVLRPILTLDQAYLYAYQKRDLLRARDLLQGHLILYGPELTGGGNLLGPFYYFLLAVPLLLGFNWVAAWYWMFMLTALGGAVGWSYFRSRHGVTSAVIWILLLSGLRPTYQVLNHFINPSFLFLFPIVALIAILRSFENDTKERRQRAAIVAGLAIGAGIQLHFSALSYLFGFIFIQIFARKLGQTPLPRRSFGAAFLAFALTLTPHLIWNVGRLFNVDLGPQKPLVSNPGWALPRMYVAVPQLEKFSLLEAVDKVLLMTPLPMLIALAAISAALVVGKRRSAKRALPPQTQGPLACVLICMLFAFVPYSYFFVAPVGFRYGVPLQVCVMFATSLIVSRVQDIPLAAKAFVTLAGVAIATLLFQVMNSAAPELPDHSLWIALTAVSLGATAVLWMRLKLRGFPALSLLLALLLIPIPSDFVIEPYLARKIVPQHNSLPSYKQWTQIWTKIYTETGWSYDEAIHRIYFVNHHKASDPQSAYESVVASLGPKPRREGPDGYFVSIAARNRASGLQWLLRQPIQQEIKMGLMEGAIRLGEYDERAPIMIAPFTVLDRNRLPTRFHNTSLSYDPFPEEHWFKGIEASTGTNRLDERTVVFKWNECPTQDRYCTTGAVVHFSPDERNDMRFHVRIVGAPLSQASVWTSPDWTESWRFPYLEIECRRSPRRRFYLATSIGLEEKYGANVRYRFFGGNNSMLAPFERDVHTPCPGGPAKITFGVLSWQVQSIPDVRILPEKGQTYSF